MKSIKFETKDVNGNPINLEVRLPTSKEKLKSREINAKVWRELSTNGVMVRDELDEFLKQRGLWGDAQEKTYDDLGKEIRTKLVTLQKGGSAGLTKKTGKALALEILELRNKRDEIVNKRNQADVHTSESIADQEQTNYLVSVCTLFGDGNGVHSGRPYFSSYEQFKERSEEEAAYDAFVKYYELKNSQSVKVESDEKEKVDLPEIKFLKDNGFVDATGRFIDPEGRLVDEDGRLINEEGRYINEDGEYVDVDGNRITEEGTLILESSPLLDD